MALCVQLHPSRLNKSPEQTVTPPGRRPGMSPTERKRRQRERERAEKARALVYETDDWRVFCD